MITQELEYDTLAFSQSFPIHRGMMHGCPLSSLLCALAIEPLAIHIRQHTDVTGVGIGGGGLQDEFICR